MMAVNTEVFRALLRERGLDHHTPGDLAAELTLTDLLGPTWREALSLPPDASPEAALFACFEALAKDADEAQTWMTHWHHGTGPFANGPGVNER